MNTFENYRILMDSLDPQNPPVVRFVHRAAPPQPKHIGVLDASFNPLTLAHEALVHQAQDTFGFDEIVLLLAKTNVDKALFGADLGQRLAMMVNYANSDTQLDTCLSVAVCSHARFIDKAHALFSPDTQIYFLVGHDTLIRIFDPRYYIDMSAELKVLFSLCHIVSANRENSSREVFHRFMSRPECTPFASRVHPLQLPPSFGNISSTEARKRIRAGDPITDLVPETIAQFIETFGLYRE
ncbi:MAG: nicotinate-nicotinamide nucleotide adenylyltransferase [Candidatus Latescibacteria bacterium]|nr:nicotinate-nicotinamide nucleotide adenylyltransferase [Candidatus Latescibacterota bacterium]